MAKPLSTVAKTRCPWPGADPLYCDYHDHEWGIPLHDDTRLFEMLVLEGFQAGLSWITILKRREHFRRAFANWNYHKISRFGQAKISELMADASIIRNRLKLVSAINNAQRFIEVQNEFGSFDAYIWKFTEYKTLLPAKPYTSLKQVPCSTKVSDVMSKDLKKRGFNFVGTIICYSFMQAVGMVNDHLAHCSFNPGL